MTGVTERPAGEAPSAWGRRLRLIGPGLVVAAGDMVSSLSAGTEFGTILIWTVILGAALKFALTEGLGRWYMATRTTILEGWHFMGWWASVYFIVYLALGTFFFGAAAPAASALATDAMFPGLMPFLAVTLLWLLNLRVPREFRSGGSRTRSSASTS